LKEITFSKRTLLMLFLILLLAGGGIILIQQFAPTPVAVTPTTPSDEAGAAQAAVAGTQAFYQIDAAEGKEAWLGRFCAASTENGCALIRQGADLLWKKYQDAGVSLRAEVRVIGSVSHTAGEWVWRVSIRLPVPLPGSNRTEAEAYVLTVKTGQGWKFERFLLEPEVQALKQRATQEAIK